MSKSSSNRVNTLDRLPRFSFGSKDRHKKESIDVGETQNTPTATVNTTDDIDIDIDNNMDAAECNTDSSGGSKKTTTSEKAERLRELTEKLKGFSPQTKSTNVPKRPNRRLPPSIQSATINCHQKTSEEPQNDQKIVATPTIYRKIPFKSVSFSQGDFSFIDGKYMRRKQSTSSGGSSGASGNVSGSGSSDLNHALEVNDRDRSLTHPLGKRAQIHSRIRQQHHNNNIKTSPPAIATTPTNNEPAAPPPDVLLTLPSVLDEINKVVLVPDKTDSVCSETQTSVGESVSLLNGEVNNSANAESNTVTVSEQQVQTQQPPRSRNSSGSSSAADKSRKRKGIYITKWPSHIDDTTKEILGGDTLDDTIYLQGDVPTNNTSSGTDEQCCTPDEWYGTNTTEGPEWPTNKLNNKILVRVDSLSESESEHRDYLTSSRPSIYSDKSDISDCETQQTNTPRRYSKRPLRGPYGQMLEAEMKKPDTNKMFSKLYYNKELKFLDDLMGNINNDNCVKTSEPSTPIPSTPNVIRTRSAGNRSLDETHMKPKDTSITKCMPQRKSGASALNIPHTHTSTTPFVRHQRTTSSPSKLEGIAIQSKDCDYLRPVNTDTNLLKNSTECLSPQAFLENIPNPNDTRTHIVVELYDTERSYVESLQTLVTKYLQPLKRPENAGLLEPAIVDEVFYQVPALLCHHEIFLDELHKRLEHWDAKQKIGDVFIDVFTKPSVVETYTGFVNNWKKAKEIIKNTAQAKPAFARFIEAMAREHKGKFALDSLLIKPIQKFPKYEMLIQRLLKHTEITHPDHQLLLEAQHHIHELLLKINCTEREMNEFEQQQQNLKELESLVEGLINLVVSDRQYLRHDLVTMVTTQGTRKDRALFLFNDLLVITSIKRRSGTVRKPSTICSASVANSLETHKYKLLMRLPLDDLEIIKPKDDNVRRMMSEIENISEDLATLNQINELIWSLHCPHEQLDEIIREMLATTNRQLAERQNSGSQVSYLELSLNTSNGIEVISIIFPKNELRASWEDAFNDAKQKLALSPNRRPLPEFMSAVPIRKTRSGLQFTCAAPTLVTTNITGTGAPGTTHASSNRPPACQDVWVCNSDGYVGQVCVLSLYPEPTVVSCNSVCNARILCMASIPSPMASNSSDTYNNTSVQYSKNGSLNLYSSSLSSYTNYKTLGGCGYTVTKHDHDTNSGNIHFDSSSSSGESDTEDVEHEQSERDHSGGGDRTSTASNSANQSALTQSQSQSTELVDLPETAQPTMWLGTEDGCIHMYNSSDNIRIKKNKIKIQHNSAVQCIIYLDNRVFVSLANGDITIYTRDNLGVWNTSDPCVISIGTASMPVIRMLPNNGKLWCGCPNFIKILNITTLQVEHTFPVSNDSCKQLSCMTLTGLGVWVSIHNSAVIKCFHANTYEMLCEINVTPTVNKMLSSCDDIIRQHKSACLRVTALLACKDLLWVGTSAGVLLTILIPHITQSTERITTQLTVNGLSHGHTGQVRFLTYVEDATHAVTTTSKIGKYGHHHKYTSQTNKDQNKILIISGGDGYEDFRNASVSELAGREDSTNHLLLWHV
ncbi:rho guanine nucleotide exchange factor 17 isoform X2 [Chrysoperla carnea]|uniref:rho guanine nucleotide exchange factor 17 isoform X2 n=1 Tax=Chrysoperla carnea TaxID=189513 RepID=UPI001D071493|nr:rho guanine nucleotide exchange factor 17 isoform X2 [Chrysoperla carnea]